jgi:chromosome segregation ATPase
MSECPECGFDWDTYVKAADKVESALAHAEARVKELEEELTSETRWAKEYSDDLLDARARVKELEEEVETLRAQINGLIRAGDLVAGEFERRVLRGEERPLDVPVPNGGENSPLDHKEEGR